MDKFILFYFLSTLYAFVKSQAFDVNGISIFHNKRVPHRFAVDGTVNGHGKYKAFGASSYEECENEDNEKLKSGKPVECNYGFDLNFDIGFNRKWTKGFILCVYKQSTSGDYKVCFIY